MQTSSQSRGRRRGVLITLEISTRGRSRLRLARPLPTRTEEEEMSTRGRSRRRLARRLATRTEEEEVTSAMGTMADTRPGRGPGRRRVEVATTRARTGTGDLTVEGAIDPAPMDIIMAAAEAAATTRTATPTATRWPGSCPPSCPWWWSPWWGPRWAISSATGGGPASGPANPSTSEEDPPPPRCPAVTPGRQKTSPGTRDPPSVAAVGGPSPPLCLWIHSIGWNWGPPSGRDFVRRRIHADAGIFLFFLLSPRSVLNCDTTSWGHRFHPTLSFF